MMITKIEGTNFKGPEFVQPLTGFDVFTGANGSGKTRRMQALMFALTGLVPGLPKKPADLFTFFSETPDGTIYAAVETDQPFKVRRRIHSNGTMGTDGEMTYKYSQKITTHPTGSERTAADHEARIRNEVGAISSVIFNFAEFVGMSDADRRKLLFSMIGADEDSGAKIKTAQDVEAYLTTMLNTAEDKIARELVAEAMKQYFDPPAEGVPAMYAWAKEKQSYYNQKKEESKGAGKHLAEVRANLESNASRLELQREELAGLNNELANIRAAFGSNEKARRMNQVRDDRITQLQQQLQNARERVEEFDKAHQLIMGEVTPELKDPAPISNQIDAIKNGIAKLTGQADAIKVRVKAYSETLDWLNNKPGQCPIAKEGVEFECHQDFSGYIQDLEERIAKLAAGEQLINERVKNGQQMLAQAQRSLDNITKAAQTMADYKKRFKEAEDNLVDAQKHIEVIEKYIIEAQQSPVVPIEDETILAMQRQGVSKRAAQLQLDIHEAERALLVAAETKGSLADSAAAEEKWRAAKALAEELGPKGLQGILMSSQLDGLLESVNGAMDSMGRSETVFFDMYAGGKEVFHFGWITANGKKRHFENLSTGEKMILTLSFLAALVNRQKGLRLLMLDEVNSLDKRNRYHLVQGLRQMRHMFDNIILAGAGLEDLGIFEGVNLVDLNAETGVKQHAEAV